MIYEFEELHPTPILSGHLAMGEADNGREKIEVNSRYFMRDGVPVIDVMGELHFSRVPREEWGDRLRKMKAGGITIVSTYLFWIYHEETEGNFDFSGSLDLRQFVREAARVGLKVVLRIGPWAHGECRHGGFPDWLLEKGVNVRTNDPEYLKYVRIWYREIFTQIMGMQHKDGGNIIGYQFDNELVNAPEHILELKRIANEIGLEAPIYTATGWNSRYGAKLPVDEVIPVFGAYADAPWAKGIDRRPPSPHYRFDPRRNDALVGSDVLSEQDTGEDGWRLPYERYPFALCELGSGIQSTYLRRTVISDMDAYALSLVKLGCGNNLIGYYMYAGGTHRIGGLSTLQETKASGSPNDYTVLNYDFHTAITEYGEVTPRYGLLNMLHLFAQDFGAILAPMEYVGAVQPKYGGDLRYCARTDGKSGFIFVNHHQRYGELEDVYNVRFKLNGCQLPAIDVKGDISFILPVNTDLLGLNLEYALAQPLCRDGNRYFFAEIPGIEAEFKFRGQEAFTLRPAEWSAKEVKDLKSLMQGGLPVSVCLETGARKVRDRHGHEIEVCVLPFAGAKYVRRLDRLLVGVGADLYESEHGLEAVTGLHFMYADLSAVDGTGRAPGYIEARNAPFKNEADIPRYGVVISHDELAELLDYPEAVREEIIAELHAREGVGIQCRKISVADPRDFIEIAEECDVEMIIADGRLVADKFYDRLPWRVPAGLIYGKKAYLITTPPRDDVFMDEIR